MQGRWRMSESKYNHNDWCLNRYLVLSTLRYKKEGHDFATKSSQQLRLLWELLIQIQQTLQKQIIQKQLSQGVLWSLWMDNRIKSKIL
jgi:thiamine kinase-like enzyme